MKQSKKWYQKRVLLLLILFGLFFLPSFSFAYDRVTAEKYLLKYWTQPYNSPPFEDYSGPGEGGDCANFGSQALIAGNILFKQKNVGFKLHQYNSAIIKANELRLYLEQNLDAQVDEKGIDETNTYRSFMQTGDIIFWIHHYGDLNFHWDPPHPPHAYVSSSDPRYGQSFNDYARHTLVINEDTGSDLLYSSHSGDLYRESLQNRTGGWWQTLYLRYLHLPDAPIIKYMKVTQVQEGRDTTVYEWNYDGAKRQMAYDPDETTGEYYKHTYDGLSPKVMYETVARGDGEKLKIKIIFDQTMNTSNIAVSFGKTSPYNTIAFTTEGWEQTLHPNDTWKGKVSIPKGKDIDGIDTISVNAFAPGTGDGT